MNTLELVDAPLVGTLIDGKVTRRPVSHYLDFLVDGVPVWSLLDWDSTSVTDLNRAFDAGTVGDTMTELLGGGRASLYVCASCGDLACGALTAQVTVHHGVVTWSDFQVTSATDDANLWGGPTAFTFDADQYRTAFVGAEQRVAAMPYDRLAHEGRPFLWPWQWGWRLPKE